jgi:uncharacterized phage-associated protein
VNHKLASLFDEKKAAQVAAFFLFKASKRNANITILKLMKLMYLAERRSYQIYGEPIIGDALVSMPHGPVLSRTLELIDFGSPQNQAGGWDELIAERSGRDMALRSEGLVTSEKDLRELSESDLEILRSIWIEFGKKSAFSLMDYTHDPANCPEWEDPDGSSVPIKLEKLFKVLGFSDEESNAILSRLNQRAWVTSTLSAR